MLVTSIPYLIGFASQGNEWHFTGFLIGVKDGNSYIAKMLSGASGSWLFRSPYSAEPQIGFLAFFPYLLLGKLTGGPAQHEQLVVLFHIYRIVAGILVSLAIYDFISLFINQKNRRIWALLIILLGGGLGWVLAITELKNFMGSVPLDFLSPESFGFLGLFGLPHLTMARACLFWGAANYLRRDRGIAAGSLWLLMGFFQPMYILVIWVVIGFHALTDAAWQLYRDQSKRGSLFLRSPYFKKALTAGLISSPFVIYTAAAMFLDGYLAAWTAQNILPSPPWIHYLIAYGLILPFAAWGTFKLFKENQSWGLFLACWILVFPFLVSAPIPTQRRLAEGIWVILITGLIGYFSDQDSMPLYGKVLIALLFPTTIVLLWGASLQARLPSSPLFVSATSVDAYIFLKEESPGNSLVLSSFEVGNSLPAWAPVRVVQGHGPETIHRSEWQAKIEEAFLDTQTRNGCPLFFIESDIDYLFWGPEEEKTWDFDPGQSTCFQEVYNSNGYKIYQVSD
jgi:hypothetical protein